MVLSASESTFVIRLLRLGGILDQYQTHTFPAAGWGRGGLMLRGYFV
jgi:hypothetical protein